MRNIRRAFDVSVNNLAAEGNLRYTARQLYYEVCRTIRQPRGFDLPTAAALFGALSLPTAAGFAAQKKFKTTTGVLLAAATAASSFVWLRNSPHTLAPPIDFGEFIEVLENSEKPANLIETGSRLDDIFQRREAETQRSTTNREQSFNSFTNSKISASRRLGVEKSVSEQAFQTFDTNCQNEIRADDFPPDLRLYGLPRLLVCESAEIAEMLRANQFHMESSCAVLSLPEDAPLPEIYREMLARTGSGRIFFLHDADFAAYTQILNLRERLALPAAAKLTILGLRPVHAERLHLFAGRKNSFSKSDLESVKFLSEIEKQWLAAGFCAEVATVPPARLLRVLRRLILGLPARSNFWQTPLLPAREAGFMSENYG